MLWCITVWCVLWCYDVVGCSMVRCCGVRQCGVASWLDYNEINLVIKNTYNFVLKFTLFQREIFNKIFNFPQGKRQSILWDQHGLQLIPPCLYIFRRARSWLEGVFARAVDTKPSWKTSRPWIYAAVAVARPFFPWWWRVVSMTSLTACWWNGRVMIYTGNYSSSHKDRWWKIPDV